MDELVNELLRRFLGFEVGESFVASRTWLGQFLCYYVIRGIDKVHLGSRVADRDLVSKKSRCSYRLHDGDKRTDTVRITEKEACGFRNLALHIYS